jgi:hypothetical protein
MDTMPERLIAWLLRSASRAVLFAGFAMLVAGGATFGMLSGDGVPHAIAVILLQIGADFALTGAAATWLSQSRAALLPNELATVADSQRPPLGWLMMLAAILVAAPVWLVFTLQPFLAEWRYVLGLLETPGLWDNANANMSGVVVIPLAAALTPPFFELAMLVGVAVTSATLLPLLMARSPRFPVSISCASCCCRGSRSRACAGPRQRRSHRTRCDSLSTAPAPTRRKRQSFARRSSATPSLGRRYRRFC